MQEEGKGKEVEKGEEGRKGFQGRKTPPFLGGAIFS